MARAPLRIGIVGLGFGVSAHLPAFRADPRCQVVALCGTRQDKTDALAAKHGIASATSDWKKLVSDPTIDAITIAIPPSEQAQVIRAALECGKHVFCEKPLAMSLAEARALTQHARTSGLAHGIDFEFRESPAWQTTREIVSRGELGRLRHVTLHWSMEIYSLKAGLVSSWKLDASRGGGVLNAFLSHSFDYLEWIFGRITSVSARLFQPEGLKADTLAALTLELENGTPILAQVSCQSYLGSGHRLEVFGDDGALILSNPTTDYLNGFEVRVARRGGDRFERRDIPQEANATHYNDGRILAVQKLATKFITAVLDGKFMTPGFEQALRVQELIDAARRSHESGGTRTLV